MVQGNWERRIELTNARRAAAKLEKANRRQQQRQRPRSNSTTTVDTTTIERSLLRLEEWLIHFGQVWNGVDNNANDGIVVDIWNDICPMSRRLEYEQYLVFALGDKDDNDVDNLHNDESKQHHDGEGAKFTKKCKGKVHPKTKIKMKQQQQQNQHEVGNNNSSIYKLCANEFFFGNCKSMRQSQQLPRGRKKSRGDSIADDDDQHEKCCSHLHYQYLPKVKKDSSNNMQQRSSSSRNIMQ